MMSYRNWSCLYNCKNLKFKAMKKLLILCLLAAGFTAGAQDIKGYQVGDKATDFELKNVDGQLVSLSDFPDAKGYILIFTCNTCPVVHAYEDRINALNEKFAPKGYPVIAINPNDAGKVPEESFEHMQARAKQQGFTYPYLLDPDHVITKQYGPTRTPHVFVLEKTGEGNIVRYIGAIDNDPEDESSEKVKYVKSAVKALLDGQQPKMTFTKAVGCTVKWKEGA